MSRLPRGLGYRRVIRALAKVGFYERRQKGSHIVLRRDDPFAQLVVPAHRAIDTGTPHSILESAGLSVEMFRELL